MMEVRGKRWIRDEQLFFPPSALPTKKITNQHYHVSIEHKAFNHHHFYSHFIKYQCPETALLTSQILANIFQHTPGPWVTTTIMFVCYFDDRWRKSWRIHGMILLLILVVWWWWWCGDDDGGVMMTMLTAMLTMMVVGWIIGLTLERAGGPGPRRLGAPGQTVRPLFWSSVW